MLRPGRSKARAFERSRTTTEWPFAGASRTISRPVPPVAPKQEPSCSISIFIGVNVAVHAVTAFWAAAKTSRADVVPATCSVPSTPIGHIAKLHRLHDNDADYVDPLDMLAELREDNGTLIGRLREVHELVDQHRDIAAKYRGYTSPPDP